MFYAPGGHFIQKKMILFDFVQFCPGGGQQEGETDNKRSHTPADPKGSADYMVDHEPALETYIAICGSEKDVLFESVHLVQKAHVVSELTWFVVTKVLCGIQTRCVMITTVTANYVAARSCRRRVSSTRTLNNQANNYSPSFSNFSRSTNLDCLFVSINC